MSKIPYFFQMPSPEYFQKNGWYKPEENGEHFLLKFFIDWCFARCSNEKVLKKEKNKLVNLDPYEFTFSISICKKETGISDRKIRVRLNLLLENNFIEKVTSKTTNRITVYRWLLDRFNRNDDNQNDKQTTSRRQADDKQPLGKKNPDTIHRTKNIEQQQEKIVAAPFDLSGILHLCQENKFPFSLDFLKDLYEKYGLDLLKSHLALYFKRYVTKKRELPENPEGWLTGAIQKNYAKHGVKNEKMAT